MPSAGRSRLAAGALLTVLCVVLPAAEAFKAHDFRYCKETSFCRRHRKFAQLKAEGGAGEATFFLHGLKQLPDGKLQGELRSEYTAAKPLTLYVVALLEGMFRVRLDEANADGSSARYQVQDVLVGDVADKSVEGTKLLMSEGEAVLESGERRVVMHTHPKPFLLRVELKGKQVVELNSRSLMKWEVYRDKGQPGALEDITGDNDGLWEESFGAHRDSRPKGPASVGGGGPPRGAAQRTWDRGCGPPPDPPPTGPAAVGMDITFPGAKHVYGLSERASSFSLPNTKGEGAARDEPYRMYNLDVFEYDVVPDRAHQPLYGAVPLMLTHTPEFSAGVLWLNAAETYVDVESGEAGKLTHWFSESGVIDLFILNAQLPVDVQGQFALLVGTQFMPPLFSLGYNQCRWNYKDEADVKQVDAKFDEHDIPYDVIWLDIEHTVGKRYMTWDKHLFPDPEGLQHDLASRGRKTVTIVDPHLKVDMGYSVYSEAKNLGYFVKDKDGRDFEGHCWPGGSSWLDYLSPQVRDYWASRFLTNNYKGSTTDLYTWNDMNEPSVFNGPEVTMQKDLKHHGDVEHREIHNQYGFYMTMATFTGHHLLRPERRPFILSRAFYTGSQRYVAVWTGDNMANWAHLAAATPMLLQLSMTGIQFCGADVGGFFNNPEPELLARWYQSAAYTPFFRGHAHIDTARREPWLFGDQVMGRIRAAIRNRYALMPYLYSLFHRAHVTGTPILRPLWFEFPEDEETYGLDDVFMLGNALLIKPVVSAGVTSMQVYLPRGGRGGAPPALWYPFKGASAGKPGGVFQKMWSSLQGGKGGGTRHTGGAAVSVDASIDLGVPVFQRGGTVVPTRERARRSTRAMEGDPFTLHVALSAAGEASGDLYMDDGDTTQHAAGVFSLFKFEYKEGKLTCSQVAGQKFASSHTVERVMVYGLAKAPASVNAVQGEASHALDFTYDKNAHVLLVRKPSVSLASPWRIVIT